MRRCHIPIVLNRINLLEVRKINFQLDEFITVSQGIIDYCPYSLEIQNMFIYKEIFIVWQFKHCACSGNEDHTLFLRWILNQTCAIGVAGINNVRNFHLFFANTCIYIDIHQITLQRKIGIFHSENVFKFSFYYWLN